MRPIPAPFRSVGPPLPQRWHLCLQPKPKHAITIAVSSRALFNMLDGRKIYEEEGLEKYMEYHLTNENVILTPGPAFRFVKVRRAPVVVPRPWMAGENPCRLLGSHPGFLRIPNPPWSFLPFH